MPGGTMAPHRTRDDVAWRKFGARLIGHEALPGLVDQHSAVAADRLGQ